MTTDSHTPEMIAMARYCYWQYMEKIAADRGNTVGIGEKEKCLRGDYDHQHGIQIALAAIKETTERAARLGANRGWASHKYAAALRNGEHYHD